MAKKTIAHTLLLILTILVSGCSSGAPDGNVAQGQITSTPTPTVMAAAVFRVKVPLGTPENDNIYVDILDEVTGLGLNPVRYPMESLGEGQYATRAPFPIGTVVKYRYTRGGTPPSIEFTTTGEQVRYRLLYVKSHVEVNDIISGWADIGFSDAMGRIQGMALDAANQLSLPHVLIEAGGAHTLTSSDGSFTLEGLPVGKHLLVAYSLTGAYTPFQQEAVVAADSATPANIQMTPAAYVNVTFVTHNPPDMPSGVPLRIAGNTYQLGNTFADMEGGVNILASRSPLMSVTSDGAYLLNVTLPVGLDLRYKYTLGDGFWNGELNEDSRPRARQLVVPSTDTIVEDTIVSWTSSKYQPITFTVTTPADTPPDDIISIQLSPFGWTAPIPMWPLGNQQWMYTLYNPIEWLGEEAHYRFCRNDQCSIADDSETMGAASMGLVMKTSGAQKIEYTINSWAWWQPPIAVDASLPADMKGRGEKFVAGIEWQVGYRSSWQPYLSRALNNNKEANANWVYLTPTWTYTRPNLPALETIPGQDPLWFDLIQTSEWAAQKNMNLAIYPQTRFEIGEKEWWGQSKKDAGWWNTWFERYRKFLLYHADLARLSNAKALVLGEPGISPALPGGMMPDGTPAMVPESAEGYWRLLITEVRQHFSGKIVWALRDNGKLQTVPSFLTDIDEVYVIWSAPLVTNGNVSVEAMTAEAGRLLDADILPLRQRINKPVVVGVMYPSSSDAGMGCVKVGDQCLPFDLLTATSLLTSAVSVNPQAQSDAYLAMLSAVQARSWIDGFVARGFYPPVALRDPSVSIYQKPTEDLLALWYARFLSQP